MTNDERVLVEHRGPVAIMTFNRPEALNALSAGMGDLISARLDQLDDDPDTRVVILTGAGKGFCSGKDLSKADFTRPGPRAPHRMLNFHAHLAAGIRTFSKPTIAAVNGVAVGAGLGIALACDMRIASDLARFCAIFAKRGIPAQDAVAGFLPQIVGLPKALEMLYTAKMVDAPEALAIGLVGEVVAPEALLPRAIAIAELIAEGPPLGLAMTKQLVYRSLGRTADDQLALQALGTFINAQNAREDIQEAAAAFKEKRAPKFRGVRGG